MVKGIKIHKNMMNRFDVRMRISTVPVESLASANRIKEAIRPRNTGAKLPEREITREKANAEMILTLGSSL
jgi:hypothetical protein